MTKYEIVQEFDIEFLRTMFEEGRLCVIRPQISDPHIYRREVLEYVGRIRDCVSDEWKDKVDVLWQRIVDAACFKDCLAFKKGLQSGHMNRYNVTNIVSRMQGRGVYRKDVSMLTLHLELEGTTQRNKYYMSCGNYTLTREAKAMLRELLMGV